MTNKDDQVQEKPASDESPKQEAGAELTREKLTSPQAFKRAQALYNKWLGVEDARNPADVVKFLQSTNQLFNALLDAIDLTQGECAAYRTVLAAVKNETGDFYVKFADEDQGIVRQEKIHKMVDAVLENRSGQPAVDIINDVMKLVLAARRPGAAAELEDALASMERNVGGYYDYCGLSGRSPLDSIGGEA